MIHRLWPIDFQIEFWAICKTKKSFSGINKRRKSEKPKTIQHRNVLIIFNEIFSSNYHKEISSTKIDLKTFKAKKPHPSATDSLKEEVEYIKTLLRTDTKLLEMFGRPSRKKYSVTKTIISSSSKSYEFKSSSKWTGLLGFQLTVVKITSNFTFLKRLHLLLGLARIFDSDRIFNFLTISFELFHFDNLV